MEDGWDARGFVVMFIADGDMSGEGKKFILFSHEPSFFVFFFILDAKSKDCALPCEVPEKWKTTFMFDTIDFFLFHVMISSLKALYLFSAP